MMENDLGVSEGGSGWYSLNYVRLKAGVLETEGPGSGVRKD